MNIGEGRAVLRAVINEATAASNAQVAAVSGSHIIVVHVMLKCTIANVLTWQSASTALSGAISFAADQGYQDNDYDGGLFQTAAGEALNLLSAQAQQVSGYLSYVLADG